MASLQQCYNDPKPELNINSKCVPALKVHLYTENMIRLLQKQIEMAVTFEIRPVES